GGEAAGDPRPPLPRLQGGPAGGGADGAAAPADPQLRGPGRGRPDRPGGRKRAGDGRRAGRGGVNLTPLAPASGEVLGGVAQALACEADAQAKACATPLTPFPWEGGTFEDRGRPGLF